jgi:15-cis-phytoene synthase
VKLRAAGWPAIVLARAAREEAPTPALLAAYAECQRITRASGSSFASAFWMLPRAKRRALHAIYAFCRLADDIADDPAVAGDRIKLLARWRADLGSAYRGKPSHPISLALGDAARRFQLPERDFSDLLLGVESDLCGEVIESWEDLERYCYRVASTVGRLVVRVLGHTDPRTLEYARNMGIAVQLTNVIRDVGEDAASGRIYLARTDLARFGVDEAWLFARQSSDALRLLLAHYAEHARLHYERAAQLLAPADRRAMRPAEAMGRIYRALLEDLWRQGFPSLERTLRVSRGRRLAIAARIWLGIGERS